MKNEKFKEILYDNKPERRGNYTYVSAHLVDIIYDNTNDVFVVFEFGLDGFKPTNKQLRITEKYLLNYE